MFFNSCHILYWHHNKISVLSHDVRHNPKNSLTQSSLSSVENHVEELNNYCDENTTLMAVAGKHLSSFENMLLALKIVSKNTVKLVAKFSNYNFDYCRLHSLNRCFSDSSPSSSWQKSVEHFYFPVILYDMPASCPQILIPFAGFPSQLRMSVVFNAWEMFFNSCQML